MKDMLGILVIECECDKSCDIGEYLDYENCKCKKEVDRKIDRWMRWKYWWIKNSQWK